jgi:hypothetical protein
MKRSEKPPPRRRKKRELSARSQRPSDSEIHEQIAVHAYFHWERRGRPHASPEVDWYWAIDEIKKQN